MMSALVVATLLAAVGCAGSKRAASIIVSPEAQRLTELAPRAAHVAADPLAYLKEVRDKCRSLKQYTLLLTREERRGLGFFARLRAPERIQAWFRRDPFSVRFKWLDPDVKYGESTYVQGEQGDKVRFTARRGFLGLEPGISRVDLNTPVVWGEAKYPVTDFGLERMMDRTLATIEDTGDKCTIRYEGLTRVTDSDAIVHYFHIEFSSPKFPLPVRELYIDANTDLPFGTRLLTSAGELDAAYRYEDVNTQVSLSDADFLLEAERKPRDTGREPADTHAATQ